MKCPKCGKKMKKDVCKKCGYNPAEVQETPVAPTFLPKINYYTYDSANPNVVYPVVFTSQPQPVSPGFTVVQPQQAQPEAPVSKKAAKKAAKKAKKAEKKAAKAAKKGASKTDKKAAKKAKKVAKKEAKLAKKNGNVVANNAVSVEMPVRKNVASRIFAVALIALCAVVFIVLKFYVVTAVVAGQPIKMSRGPLFGFLTTIIASPEKLFGVLPAWQIAGLKGMLYTLSSYAFILCTVLAVIHAVFAIFSKAKAPRRVRRSLFFLGIGALQYVAALAILLNKLGASINVLEGILVLAGYYVDMFALIIGAAGLVLSLLFLIFGRKNKNK